MDRTTISLLAGVAFFGVAFIAKATIFTSSAAVHTPINARALAVELIVHRPVPAENASTRKDWNEFKKADYFGAFAYNPTDGSYGYLSDMASVDQARQIALETCASYSNSPSGCRIYAELRPAAELSLLPRRSSRTVETNFVREYLPSVSALHEGAFAINNQGFYGWSAELALFGGAQEEALRECELAVVEARRDGYFDDGTEAPSKCAVVHTK